jgi:membrane protease YdiL (CAAX protease family)
VQRGSADRIHDWICWGVIVGSYLVSGAASWFLANRTDRPDSDLETIVNAAPRFVPPTALLVVSSLATATFLGATLSLRCRARMRMRPKLEKPSVHGGKYLESFAVPFALLVAMIAMLLLAFAANLRSGPLLLATLALSLFHEPLAIAYAFARCRSLRVPLAEWGWRRGRGIGRELLIGACFGFLIFPLRLLPGEALRADDSALIPIGAVVFGLLRSVVWVPIMEETLGRGMLYRHLRDHLRWPAAVAISAALFAIMHLSLAAFPAHFISGVTFALLREWRGSLLAPVAAHAAINLAAGIASIDRIAWLF